MSNSRYRVTGLGSLVPQGFFRYYELLHSAPQDSKPVSAVDLEQSTGWAIWQIASPVMLSSVLFTFQTTVNIFWVSRLGKQEMAAVALAGSVLGVFYTLGTLISAGTLATCARFAGANDRQGIRESLFHSLLLSIILGGIVAAASVPFSRELLSMFGAEPEVITLGADFLRILLLVSGAQFAGSALAGIFQALGDTKTPMWIAGATNLVNLGLDPLLILGVFGFPKLGIVGAALATGLSQLLAVIFLFGLLAKQGYVLFRQPIRHQLLAGLLHIGAPASLQAITRPLTGMLLFRVVASYGSSAVAAFGVGLRILNIMYIYLQGLSTACQSLVGQNLGARRPQMAEQVANRIQLIAIGLQVLVLTLLFVTAPKLIGIFNSDREVVSYGVSYLRMLAPFLILLGPSTAWSGAQYGAGDTSPTAVAALVANWLVKLPLAYILSRMTVLALSGVWLGIGVSIVVETVILGISYHQGNWRRKEVIWQTTGAAK